MKITFDFDGVLSRLYEHCFEEYKLNYKNDLTWEEASGNPEIKEKIYKAFDDSVKPMIVEGASAVLKELSKENILVLHSKVTTPGEYRYKLDFAIDNGIKDIHLTNVLDDKYIIPTDVLVEDSVDNIINNKGNYSYAILIKKPYNEKEAEEMSEHISNVFITESLSEVPEIINNIEVINL